MPNFTMTKGKYQNFFSVEENHGEVYQRLFLVAKQLHQIYYRLVQIVLRIIDLSECFGKKLSYSAIMDADKSHMHVV